MPQPENALDRSAPEAPPQTSSETPSEPMPSSGSSVVGGRYEIDFSDRLIHLDSPQAQAFAVRDLEGVSRHRFALVLKRNSYGRFARRAEFGTVDAGAMLQSLSHGTIAVPGVEHQRMTLVLERPAGGRVMMREGR